MDVKEEFKKFINTYIKSLMKENGYKKKALNFYKQTEDLYYIINLQKSHGNSYAELNFYVNCGVYSSKITEVIGDEALAFPKEGNCQWRNRIRSITPIGQARYSINRNPDCDIETMGVVLKTALEEALVVMESIQTTDQLVEILCTQGSRIRDLFRYCIRTEQRANATKLIQSNYKRFGKEDRWERIRNLFLDVLKEEKSNWSFKLLQQSIYDN